MLAVLKPKNASFVCTVKPVFRGESKIDKTKMTNSSFMNVESFVEYFTDLH